MMLCLQHVPALNKTRHTSLRGHVYVYMYMYKCKCHLYLAKGVVNLGEYYVDVFVNRDAEIK